MTFNQIMALLLALGLVGSHAWVYHLGGQETRKDAAEQRITEMVATQEIIDAERARADKAEQALREKLNEPEAAPKIRTVVRENPSSCVIPKPVDDRVREAGDKANAAIRSSL